MDRLRPWPNDPTWWLHLPIVTARHQETYFQVNSFNRQYVMEGFHIQSFFGLYLHALI
jgi:hypothetical protein